MSECTPCPRMHLSRPSLGPPNARLSFCELVYLFTIVDAATLHLFVKRDTIEPHIGTDRPHEWAVVLVSLGDNTFTSLNQWHMQWSTVQSLAKCPIIVQYLHQLRRFLVTLDLCSAVSGCDPDTADDDGNFSGGILTSVGGLACYRGASQLPYILGSNLDVSRPELHSILLQPLLMISLCMCPWVR